MKRKHLLTVRGREHVWAFCVEIDPTHVEEMRRDGIGIQGEVFNTVPKWVADCGLMRLWCFAQDIFNLRNPFARS